MFFFNRNIEQVLFTEKLKAGRPMTELQFFAAELTEWETSPARKEMLDGSRYYQGEHDILKRKRTAIGKDGQSVELKYLPNNRIVDNQYAKHVDQKKNYLLGKSVTFKSDKTEYADKVGMVLGKQFMKTLKNAGLDSLNTGIAWLHPYINDEGKLEFKAYSGHEILPFWKDAAHTKLDCACRLYQVETYYGTEKRIIKKVNIFKADGLYTYILDNGTLIPDSENAKTSYLTYTKSNGSTESYNWNRIPLIAIKYNAQEIPLIRRARSLQDAINRIQSDFVNNMEEDVHSTVLVLKNYDGQNPDEARANIAAHGIIKVRTFEGTDGGVDTLRIEVDSENYKTVLEMLKSSLIENMRSFDGKDDRLKSSPNQMNIQSLYMDIDLDANDMETELQAAFEDILWFVNQYLANNGEGDYEGEDITVIFNRDTLVNEGEAIENCGKSVGIISDETIVSQHPWVENPIKELERLAKQKEKEQQEVMSQYDPFGNLQEGNDVNVEQ